MPRCIDKTPVFLPYRPAEDGEEGRGRKSAENPFFDRYESNRSKFNDAAARDISEGREKSYGCGGLCCVWRTEGKEVDRCETRAQKEGIDVLIYSRIKSVGEVTRGESRIRRGGQEISLPRPEATVLQGSSPEARKFFKLEFFDIIIFQPFIINQYTYIYIVLQHCSRNTLTFQALSYFDRVNVVLIDFVISPTITCLHYASPFPRLIIMVLYYLLIRSTRLIAISLFYLPESVCSSNSRCTHTQRSIFPFNQYLQMIDTFTDLYNYSSEMKGLKGYLYTYIYFLLKK